MEKIEKIMEGFNKNGELNNKINKIQYISNQHLIIELVKFLNKCGLKNNFLEEIKDHPLVKLILASFLTGEMANKPMNKENLDISFARADEAMKIIGGNKKC